MFLLPFPVGVIFFLAVAVPFGLGQQTGKANTDSSATATHAVSLAESGHCSEALTSLRKTAVLLKDRDLKLKVTLAGARCAMTLHQTDAALEFLRALSRDFPRDPDALYVSIHAFSDLSTYESQELARSAPTSYQAHELLAESFESRGNWENAEKEYREILKQDPNLPGIHFRLGRALLSKPNPGADIVNEAKSEFEQELKIDPKNAGAEYVLGELARQGQDWEEAVEHFSRASKLDPQFGEAFFGLGASLVAEKQFEKAIAPLEAAVKLDPANPDAHYSLGMAYTRVGRKQDGEKEFAIHKQIMSTGGDKDQSPDAQSK